MYKLTGAIATAVPTMETLYQNSAVSANLRHPKSNKTTRGKRIEPDFAGWTSKGGLHWRCLHRFSRSAKTEENKRVLSALRLLNDQESAKTSNIRVLKSCLIVLDAPESSCGVPSWLIMRRAVVLTGVGAPTRRPTREAARDAARTTACTDTRTYHASCNNGTGGERHRIGGNAPQQPYCFDKWSSRHRVRDAGRSASRPHHSEENPAERQGVRNLQKVLAS